MICILIYILFIIYFLISEIRSLMRLKRDYFRQFWSWIEMAIIFCSLGCIVVYFWRFKESKRLGTLFEKTNGYAYVNLQLAVYVNDVFTFLFGFCCFFANIKFIRLFRSNPRLSLFVHTLRIAAKELLYFAVMFSIVFFSFLALFHLLFVSNIADCSTMLGTAQMLFEITLMKFDVSELLGASAVIGPVVFTFFIILVVFVCLSMFLSIINQSFRLARQNIIDNEHMFTFMMTRFLRWTGENLCCRSNTSTLSSLDCRSEKNYCCRALRSARCAFSLAVC